MSELIRFSKKLSMISILCRFMVTVAGFKSGILLVTRPWLVQRDKETCTGLDGRSRPGFERYEVGDVFIKVACYTGVDSDKACEQSVIGDHKRLGGDVCYCDSSVEVTTIGEVAAAEIQLCRNNFVRLCECGDKSLSEVTS